jgi:hypothetical protein
MPSCAYTPAASLAIRLRDAVHSEANFSPRSVAQRNCASIREHAYSRTLARAHACRRAINSTSISCGCLLHAFYACLPPVCGGMSATNSQANIGIQCCCGITGGSGRKSSAPDALLIRLARGSQFPRPPIILGTK